MRLSRNLTYDALALEVGLSRRNLFRLMNDRRASIQDRSLHKMREDPSRGCSGSVTTRRLIRPRRRRSDEKPQPPRLDPLA